MVRLTQQELTQAVLAGEIFEVKGAAVSSLALLWLQANAGPMETNNVQNFAAKSD